MPARRQSPRNRCRRHASHRPHPAVRSLSGAATRSARAQSRRHRAIRRRPRRPRPCAHRSRRARAGPAPAVPARPAWTPARSAGPAPARCPAPIAIARRTPVNAPGPRPMAIASSCDLATPASASSCSAQGNDSSAWRRGAISKRSCTSPSSHRATEQASVAVSKASSFMRGNVDCARGRPDWAATVRSACLPDRRRNRSCPARRPRDGRARCSLPRAAPPASRRGRRRGN